MHDTLGHVFASLTLKSELAMKLIDQQPAKARDEIESINELSKDTLKKSEKYNRKSSNAFISRRS